MVATFNDQDTDPDGAGPLTVNSIGDGLTVLLTGIAIKFNNEVKFFDLSPDLPQTYTDTVGGHSFKIGRRFVVLVGRHRLSPCPADSV